MSGLRLALWFALALGLAETAANAARAQLLGTMTRVTPQAIWMAPLAYAVAFVAIAVILAAAFRRSGTYRSIHALYGVFTFLGTVAILSIPGIIHNAAILIIATGLAVRIATWSVKYERTFERAVGLSFAPLAGIIVVGALVTNAFLWITEERANNRSPEALAGASNLILIVWDTVRAASLDLYGFDVVTPNLARLAERGMTFDMALATTSWTLPSHGSMFTGYAPYFLSTSWFDPLDDAKPTLAEALADRGFRTGGFVSNLLYTTREYGLARGFVHYEDYRISVGQAIMSTSLGRMAFDTPPEADWRPGPIQQLIGRAFIPGRKSARQVNEDFLEWVDEEPDRPFFAFLNLFDAHRPYDAPSRIRRGFPPVDSAEPVMQRVAAFVQPPAADDVTDHELLEMRASYHAAIASLDEQLGLLLDALDERGRLQNTIIVLTSDHGEEFREHDGLGHGSNLYFWQLRVPLVIVAPGRTPPGGRVSQPVSLVDLPATLAPWLTGGSAGFPGRSLEASWTDDPDGSSVSMPIAELVPGRNRDRAARAMASDGLYVIRNVDGSVEVYDLAATPFQSQQLHVMESVADSLGRLLDDSVEPSDGGAPAASNASAGR